MPRQRRRPRPFARALLATAALLVALPAATAVAGQQGAPERRASAPATPHLDAVEKTLREVSPGLEGPVWQRTSGNALDAGWLLQTPGCWGDHTCADRRGSAALLARITDAVSKATRTVDFSSLAPLPDGPFQEALVAGLKSAVAAGHEPRVRVLVGAAPIYHRTVVPANYLKALNAKLGPAAASVTVTVASMTTSTPGLSWNHSKILLVDGATAIVGGINFWEKDYVATAHPVADVSMAISGPAAGAAGQYLDTLWAWTCRNAATTAKVWLAASAGAACAPTLHRGHVPAATGTVPAIAVGSLGVGIKDVDETSSHRPTLPGAQDPACRRSGADRINADRDHETVNPDEAALRTLIDSARSTIEISQQDVNGLCPAFPRYDVRLYDTLARKLADGVKVRIVVSDPANRGAVGSGGYSQIKSLAEVSDTLQSRLALVTGDKVSARAAMCRGLQLATFRNAPEAKWADGEPYALHHKLVVVDDTAFYLGSRNLYPVWLQEFGYIVEDRAATATLQSELVAPMWEQSQVTATFDYAKGVCRG